MKRAIYINCCGDPWFKVAKKLNDEFWFKPVYWIGSPTEDPTLQTIHEVFPDIIFHNAIDAWKDRFPTEIQEKAPYYYLDVDFLKKYAHQELQAIKMMDRMDQDQHSFNFMERQRHFRNMLKQWMAAIDLIKPDIVINSDIPHRLYDYVLFWLCKERDIPYLMVHRTPFWGRFFFTKNEFFSIENRFVDDWHKYEGVSGIEDRLPEDIKSRLSILKEDYSLAIPDYMVKQRELQKRTDSFWFQTRRLIWKFRKPYRPYLLGQPAPPTVIGHSAYSKNAKKKFEESDESIYQHELTLIKIGRNRKRLKKAYDSLTTAPDYDEPFVIFFLHYQPEQTTCPSGDIFVDQRLCVELLLKNLPSNYKVYVKEHPSQFNRGLIGHCGRMRDLYDDLIKNNRVKLVSIEEESFNLIQHAKAVCTVTGTVGWEAMVRQKPVIAFGVCWYENYDKGVLRIKDESSAKNIRSFLESYEYDEHSLMAYLASVGDNTRKAYHWLWAPKDKIGVSEEECVNNIVEAILEQL